MLLALVDLLGQVVDGQAVAGHPVDADDVKTSLLNYGAANLIQEWNKIGLDQFQELCMVVRFDWR